MYIHIYIYICIVQYYCCLLLEGFPGETPGRAWAARARRSDDQILYIYIYIFMISIDDPYQRNIYIYIYIYI